METTYDVRIHKVEKRVRAKKTTYRLEWRVDGERFRETFASAGLAQSFRADLLSAARQGEAFRLLDGLPVSKARTANASTWFDFAQSYIDFNGRMRHRATAGTWLRH